MKGAEPMSTPLRRYYPVDARTASDGTRPDGDVAVGLDGLEPSTSALSVLLSAEPLLAVDLRFSGLGEALTRAPCPLRARSSSDNAGRNRFSRAMAASRSAPSLTWE